MFTLLAILVGTFIVPVNSTMISVGLGSIADSFQTTFSHVSWIVTIYLIIMTVTQPLAGKLGDLYGNRRVFLIGIVLFLIASVICIYAQSLAVLIFGRAVQAFGGALITPNGTAILRYITPKENLAKAFGTFGFSMSIGAAIGPLVGALLIHQWDWHATFWVNIPLLLVSFVCAYKFLPKMERKQKAPLDLVGAALLATWLTTLVLIVTQGAYANGWMWLIVVVAFVLFIYREKTFRAPLIDFELFRHKSFRNANISILMNNGIMYGTLLLMPVLLTMDERFSLTEVGIALFAFSVSISIFSWIGGRVEGVLGRRKTIQLSFLSTFFAVLFYFYLPVTESLVVLVIVLFIGGIGSGLGVPSMQAASLSDIPKEISGVASGIYSTFRYIGSTMASVLIGMQFSSQLTLSILICCAVIGVVTVRGFEKGQVC